MLELTTTLAAITQWVHIGTPAIKYNEVEAPSHLSEVHSEEKAATEDRLSVKVSEDELEALVGGTITLG